MTHRKPEWIDFHPDPRIKRPRFDWSLWLRVTVTLVTLVACAAIVGLVAALQIASSLP